MINTFELVRSILKELEPPKKITVSEYAGKYRKLSVESSPEPGDWDNTRAPYQAEMMDSFNGAETEDITIMSGAQIAKTEIILNMVLYVINNDPGGIMIVQPSKGMAKSFSKKRIAPMIRDCETLANKVKGQVLDKYFPGGFLMLIGANSTNELAGTPIRYLFMDEVDRYKRDVGNEGDPVELAEKRTANFENRKKVRVSTPGLKKTSKIYSLYMNSTQETWQVPCPECGKFNKFKIENFDFESIEMACEHCGVYSSEAHWRSNEPKGKFIQENLLCETKFHRGFYVTSFSSPWVKWKDISKKYKEALENPERMQVFYNTFLGLPYEHEFNDGLDWEYLYKNRRIKYNAEVPDEVLFLTCGVDVQDDRLEANVIGWGPRRQRYGIQYKIILGDPGSQKVWNELDSLLNKNFYYKDKSNPLKIICTFIDTGGHHTEETYDYVYLRESKNIFGIKGIGTSGSQVINTVRKTKRPKGKNIQLISLGVNALKDMTYSALKRDEKGPLYCYYPDDPIRGYGERFFKSVTGEVKTTTVKSGIEKVEWVKIRDNEALDTTNYATAGMIYMNPDFESLAKMTKEELSKLSLGEKKEKKETRIESKGVQV
ncbi:terminase gpA endonuclease subunit [uncultured Clostridium sp.]|uniref:phage terminase large subunit family protein n=1 Tax=uncultured Clostridium sp. TaxID=59620 RepID=UPI00261991FB|nr:terminase gpA endonuclease subunit [uncultured Clostridium sp.]